MSESFDGDWLARREPFDAAARSSGLALRFARALPAGPRLLDLGAGTGSLFRWLAPRIGRAQHWMLLDADPQLLARALRDTARWAERRGYAAGLSDGVLEIVTQGGRWTVATVVADLARPGALPLADMDGVVCSALLDLASERWLEVLAGRLTVPLLACMNVDGRDAFLPRHAADHVVAAGFRRDQAREKGLGRALGPQAPMALRRIFAARGFGVMSAASDWRIQRAAIEMLADMVNGHAAAALPWQIARQAAIEDWRRMRMRQALGGALAIRIGHRDTLLLPKGGT